MSSSSSGREKKKKKKDGGSKDSSRGPSPVAIPALPETAETRQRRSHVTDSEVVIWCNFNGISSEQFITRAHLISRMESFQARPFVHDLSAMRFFTGLTELCIMAQPSFTSLNGLQYCPNLSELLEEEKKKKRKKRKKKKEENMCFVVSLYLFFNDHSGDSLILLFV